MNIIKQEEQYMEMVSRTKHKYWAQIRNKGIKFTKQGRLWRKMIEILKDYKDLGEIREKM